MKIKNTLAATGGMTYTASRYFGDPKISTSSGLISISATAMPTTTILRSCSTFRIERMSPFLILLYIHGVNALFIPLMKSCTSIPMLYASPYSATSVFPTILSIMMRSP